MAEPQFGVGAELAGQAAGTAQTVDEIANKNAQQNSSNALEGVKQVTGFTQDLALEQQKAQMQQQISMQKYNAGYVKVTPALAVGLAGATNNPDMLKFQDQEVPAGLLLGLVKNSGAQSVAKTKADSASDVADTNADARTDSATIAANAKTQVQGMKDNAPPKPLGGANAGLKTDEDAHKYADQWYDRVQKANNSLMGTFQKKLGVPEGDTAVSDFIDKWTPLPDDKKKANQAVFRQAIAQYEHAKNTYNKYAAAAGQDPYPEDTDTINQLKKLAGGAPASSSKPAPADTAKRQKAIDYLTKNKQKVTDQNIAYVMSQQQ